MEPIDYDWDPDKFEANLHKHGLDFNDAWQVYEHPEVVTWEDPYPHEDRYRDLAPVNSVVRLLVYTLRDGVVWCISFRKADRRESQKYYEEINRR